MILAFQFLILGCFAATMVRGYIYPSFGNSYSVAYRLENIIDDSCTRLLSSSTVDNLYSKLDQLCKMNPSREFNKLENSKMQIDHVMRKLQTTIFSEILDIKGIIKALLTRGYITSENILINQLKVAVVVMSLLNDHGSCELPFPEEILGWAS